MKIHGTAKGGALSTKDFGVAFGGVPVVAPTYTGDMSSGWSQTGSEGVDFTIDSTHNEVDLLDSYNAENVYFDTSTIETLSTTQWTIRFTYQITGTASGDNPVFWLGMSETGVTAANATATDFTGFGTQTLKDSTTLVPYLYMCNNERLDSAGAYGILQLDSSNIVLVSNNTKYYVQVNRDGSTFYVKVYEDSGYTELLGERSNATPDGTLRYFIIANYIQGSGCTGTFSDFKWWNDSEP